jgi:hypothetical protein
MILGGDVFRTFLPSMAGLQCRRSQRRFELAFGKPSRQSEGASLTELIEAALNVDNLRMEEAGQRELRTLLQALEISVQRVKAALAAM